MRWPTSHACIAIAAEAVLLLADCGDLPYHFSGQLWGSYLGLSKLQNK